MDYFYLLHTLRVCKTVCYFHMCGAWLVWLLIKKNGSPFTVHYSSMGLPLWFSKTVKRFLGIYRSKSCV